MRPLRLQDFLRMEAWVDTGGQAKQVIQGGLVRVNGEVETRRGRKLCAGDEVVFAGRRAQVPADASPAAASPAAASPAAEG